VFVLAKLKKKQGLAKKILLMKNLSLFLGFIAINYNVFSQSYLNAKTQQAPTFWEKLEWGGSGGVSFGSGFSNVLLAPAAIYPVNSLFSTGLGLTGSYVYQRDFATSFVYGASWLTFLHPLEEVQFSLELEQLRIDLNPNINARQTYWNTALFVGFGYRQDNFVMGLRYNVLHRPQDGFYSEAWTPFIRAFF
jgi:hypothetical protein